MKRIILLLAILSLLTITGCNTLTPGPTPTSTPTPIPTDIAFKAGEKMLEVYALHFIMELSGSLTYLDEPPTMALKSVEGDVELPDRVRAIVRISSLGMISEVGIIGLGADQYITNPLNQQWEQLPAGMGWYFDPALLFDPEYGIASILEEAGWAFRAGEGDEEEGNYYILHGRVPSEKLFYLTSGMITSGEVDTEIWVSEETFHVHQIKLVELESDPENPTQWIIKLSDFDNPVGITAPPIQPKE